MARRILTKTIDEGAGTVTITVAGQEPVTLSLGELPEGILRRAALHGISQKLGDSVAGARERGWSAADMREVIADLAQRLREGQWNARGAPTGGLLAEALARLTGRDEATIRARLAELDEEARRALARRPDVAAEMHRLRAERLAAQAEERGLEGLFD